MLAARPMKKTINVRGESLLKPHYLFRPRQALRRLAHLFSRPPGGPVVAVLPWGLPLRVDPREAIGRAIWQLGLDDLTVCEVLWRLMEPGTLAVDVGANLGQMTGLLALRAGPAGRVLAFEPHPAMFARLEDNVRSIRRDPRAAPVDLVQAAVTAAPGTAWLDPGPSFAANHGLAHLAESPGSGFLVETATLDSSLGSRSATVAKIDVEGCELDVLRGSEEALRAGRIRHLVFEAHDAEQRRALAALLGERGYTVLSLGRSRLGPVTGPADEPPRLPSYEAPSYLATREPDQARARLRPRGWQVLSRAASRLAPGGPAFTLTGQPI